MALRVWFVLSKGLDPAICGQEEVDIAGLGSGRGLVRRVEREAFPAPLMLKPGVPAGGMMKAAVLSIGFPEEAILPVTDIGLGKVAELWVNSATFRVLIRRFVCSHELLVVSIE